MFCDIENYLNIATYLFFVCVKTGFSVESTTVREIRDTRWRTTVLPRTKSSSFMNFPNTTWKNASNVCLNLSARLLLAYNDDIIRWEVLPRMKTREFIWVSVKDYGLNCRNKTGQESNSTEKVCDSYVRVNMKPTMERLHYGLCEKSGGIQRQHSGSPLTWQDMNKYCTSTRGRLYKFSSIEEGRTLLSIIRPDQLFWTRKPGNKDFPDFNHTAEVLPVCVGLVKLNTDSYIYMADSCDSKHNFICDNSHVEYAPAVEALEGAAPFYAEEEVDRAIIRDMSKSTPADFPDGENQTLANTVPERSDLSQFEEPTDIGTIVGPVVAGVIVVVVAGIAGVYCYRRVRKAKAYRKSLFRYETKKSSSNTQKLTCQEITHLTLPEPETSSYNDEPSGSEPEHDDVYYERRYEPLQRELVDACTKRLKMKKGALTEDQLNQLMNYDPLRKDSFLSSAHGSSYSDGLTISYEKYDPDSDAMEQQRQTLHTISPKKCKLNQNQGSGSGSVSYLNKVKTLDDLDQYENSSSLQEKTIELVEDICKFQKDSENEIEKLEDLDQYENYNLPPLPALPTKTRPKKTAKSGTGASARIVPRQDCYENHDI